MSEIKTKTIQVPPEIHEELSEIQLWLVRQLRKNFKIVRNVTYPEVISFLLILNEDFRKNVEKDENELKRILDEFIKKTG